MTIGKITPPQAVLTQTNATAAQKQMKKTNDERALAELSREQAERNAAIADKAYMKEFGMTTTQYLRSRELDIQEAQIEMAEKKGTGVTMIFNQGAVPTFNAR